MENTIKNNWVVRCIISNGGTYSQGRELMDVKGKDMVWERTFSTKYDAEDFLIDRASYLAMHYGYDGLHYYKMIRRIRISGSLRFGGAFAIIASSTDEV